MLEATFDLFVPLVMADIVNVGIAAHDFHYILVRCKHAFALVALQVAKHPVQKNSSFGVKIHLIITRCMLKIQCRSCVLHCTSCQILLY